MDHIGGVRGYIADGADLIVGDGTEEHYESIFKSHHRIYPDAYSENPRDVAIHELDNDEESTISDGIRKVHLVPIANQHAVGMLAPYIEDAKMLFVSDLYNPGLFPGEIQPNFSFWARDLYDDLQTKNLDVQWLVGAHGGVVRYDVFEQQV